MVKLKLKGRTQDIIYTTFVYVCLSVILMFILYPLVYVVSASFTEANDVLSGKMVLFPTSFTLATYQKIFAYKDIWTGFANSAFYVVVGTALSLLFTLTAAYPLSRRDFVLKGFIMKVYAVTLFFGGGLIPYFLVVKGLGLYNTRWALIIPSAVSVWNIVLVRTYFLINIPSDLLDAAKVDGCNNLRFFVQIALPLSTPIIAVMIMYYGLGKWNSYFDALIFLDSPSKYPLSLILRTLLVGSQMDQITGGSVGGSDMVEQLNAIEGMKYGVIVVASVPMVVLCTMTQKYFQKGIMVGSLKG